LTGLRSWSIRPAPKHEVLERQIMTRAFIVALALTAAVSAASAGDATGLWIRDDGSAKLRFVPCGGGGTLCGFLAWKKESGGPTRIGQKLFFDMRPNGENAWAGSAFNPNDGKRYTAKLALSGDHLVTAGCVLGGLICKSFEWTRSREGR
jgi:uncharacterized protein (DUF2147 family)